MRGVFEEFASGKPVTPKFPRIAYDDAIRKYGSDKPDLRNPIEMQDVTEHFRGSGFKVFAGMIEKDPKARVWAIPAPGGGSRAFCDRMNALGAVAKASRGSATSSGAAQAGQRSGSHEAPKAPTEYTPTLERSRRRSHRQEHRPERTESCVRNSGSEMATPCSSPPATRTSSTSSPARRAPRSAAS